MKIGCLKKALVEISECVSSIVLKTRFIFTSIVMNKLKIASVLKVFVNPLMVNLGFRIWATLSPNWSVLC